MHRAGDVGGVVFLAGNVPANELIFPDALANAPEAYNQGYTQLLANAINTTVNNQKVINRKLNDIITSLIEAKQMSSQ